jgi:NAD-dependent DNA ligase
MNQFNKMSMYLMAAHAYYVDDDPIISDWEFDNLAKYLLDNYNDIKHPHKSLISEDDLRAGTYLGPYPEIVKGALNRFRRNEMGYGSK